MVNESETETEHDFVFEDDGETMSGKIDIKWLIMRQIDRINRIGGNIACKGQSLSFSYDDILTSYCLSIMNLEANLWPYRDSVYINEMERLKKELEKKGGNNAMASTQFPFRQRQYALLQELICRRGLGLDSVGTEAIGKPENSKKKTEEVKQ